MFWPSADCITLICEISGFGLLGCYAAAVTDILSRNVRNQPSSNAGNISDEQKSVLFYVSKNVQDDDDSNFLINKRRHLLTRCGITRKYILSA
jgi:hypothetical protein